MNEVGADWGIDMIQQLILSFVRLRDRYDSSKWSKNFATDYFIAKLGWWEIIFDEIGEKFTWIPATKKIGLQHNSYSPWIRQLESKNSRKGQLQCKNSRKRQVWLENFAAVAKDSRKRQAECRAHGAFQVYKNKTLGREFLKTLGREFKKSRTRVDNKIFYNFIWST